MILVKLINVGLVVLKKIKIKRVSILVRAKQLYELGMFIDEVISEYSVDQVNDKFLLAGDLNVDSRNCCYSLECLNNDIPLLKVTFKKCLFFKKEFIKKSL